MGKWTTWDGDTCKSSDQFNDHLKSLTTINEALWFWAGYSGATKVNAEINLSGQQLSSAKAAVEFQLIADAVMNRIGVIAGDFDDEDCGLGTFRFSLSKNCDVEVTRKQFKPREDKGQ